MKSNDTLTYKTGEKSMEFLPLDVMTDQYAEPRIESYCTIAKVHLPMGEDCGVLELHHHLIVADNWTSHTIEPYTYYIKCNEVLSVQDAETGERKELQVTKLENNLISFTVL